MKKHNFENDLVISSLKIKNPISFLKKAILMMNDEEKEIIKTLIQNKEIFDDVKSVYQWFYENFKSEDIPEFMINLEANSEKAALDVPQLNNVENLKIIYRLMENLYDRRLDFEHKIILKKNIYEKFNIKSETFVEWLRYFEFDDLIGLKELSSLQYAELMKKLMIVEGLNYENVKLYHFEHFSKLTIAKVIFGASVNEKTLYRKLKKLNEEIDDLDPDNRFLEWIQTHDKLPFSLAYRWTELLLKVSNKNDENVLIIFEKYFESLKE